MNAYAAYALPAKTMMTVRTIQSHFSEWRRGWTGGMRDVDAGVAKEVGTSG